MPNDITDGTQQLRSCRGRYLFIRIGHLVRRETNGGVTILGTLAGFAGALTIAITSAVLLPFCAEGTAWSRHIRDAWGWREKFLWILAITIWGGCGSLVDSALGGWFQASVVDTRTGKVIEGTGGKKV